MQNYLLIVFGCAISAMLITGAGCAKSSHRAEPTPVASPNDVNSANNAEFGEFEEEMAGKELHIADPLEPLNRTMFGVNDVLYFWVVKPVAKTYSNIVPKPGRIGVRNFFGNLTTPVRLVNSLLQGKGKAASREIDRFAINTTVGILGVGDPAADKYKIFRSDEDLGQTLAVYGIGDVCYLVLPLFGPSTLRDTGGMAGDMFLNPVYYIEDREVAIGVSAFRFTNDASFRIGEYEAFKEAAMDPYVAMREAYIQNREKKIKE